MDHQKLMQELVEFRHSRGWDEYHNLKNLAESVNIESSRNYGDFPVERND